MIFTPFPRRVGPISSPPPFADANVASMKHSDSSISPSSRSFNTHTILRHYIDVRNDFEIGSRIEAHASKWKSSARRRQLLVHRGLEVAQRADRCLVVERQILHHQHSTDTALRVDPELGIVETGPA